ncbi:MAG: P27 family phage terminase small subunit [Colwellia sp.]|nr:P27 family phage terminase small subunit [Colwellia sp.]
MEKNVRDNPPFSVADFLAQDLYRVLYDDITHNGTVIQYVDRHALGELAVTLCEMNRLRNELVENGEAIESQGDRNMVTKKNPAREALQRLYPVMMKLFAEFKMTPGSRGKNFSGKGETGKTINDGFNEV